MFDFPDEGGTNKRAARSQATRPSHWHERKTLDVDLPEQRAQLSCLDRKHQPNGFWSVRWYLCLRGFQVTSRCGLTCALQVLERKKKKRSGVSTFLVWQGEPQSLMAFRMFIEREKHLKHTNRKWQDSQGVTLTPARDVTYKATPLKSTRSTHKSYKTQDNRRHRCIIIKSSENWKENAADYFLQLFTQALPLYFCPFAI